MLPNSLVCQDIMADSLNQADSRSSQKMNKSAKYHASFRISSLCTMIDANNHRVKKRTNNSILNNKVRFIILSLLVLVCCHMGNNLTVHAATTAPSEAPTMVPTLSPTRIPTVIPTVIPTAIPTVIPTATPTAAPTLLFCDPGERISGTLCVPCTPGTFSSAVSSLTCTLCAMGTYNNVTSATGCNACPPGSAAPALGSLSCIQCVAGSFADTWASEECTQCEIGTYSSVDNSTSVDDCKQCPFGRITADTGTTSKDECFDPLYNFISSTIALTIAIMLLISYLIGGRFHRIAYIRKEYNLFYAMNLCTIIALKLTKFNKIKVLEYPTKSSIRTILFFSFSITIIICFIIVFYISSMVHVFYSSLIIWRGLSFSIEIPFTDVIVNTIQDIGDLIRLPKIFPYIFYPFVYVFGKLSLLVLNLNSVNVTCEGSQASIELLINCLVLGFTVIVIESDYQAFWDTTFYGINEALVNNSFFENFPAYFRMRTLKYYRFTFYAFVVWALSAFHPFRIVLQYLMGFITLRAFIEDENYLHRYTESCDLYQGLKYDSTIGTIASIFAIFLLQPAVYTLAKVLVPRIPDWALVSNGSSINILETNINHEDEEEGDNDEENSHNKGNHLQNGTNMRAIHNNSNTGITTSRSTDSVSFHKNANNATTKANTTAGNVKYLQHIATSESETRRIGSADTRTTASPSHFNQQNGNGANNNNNAQTNQQQQQRVQTTNTNSNNNGGSSSPKGLSYWIIFDFFNVFLSPDLVLLECAKMWCRILNRNLNNTIDEEESEELAHEQSERDAMDSEEAAAHAQQHPNHVQNQGGRLIRQTSPAHSHEQLDQLMHQEHQQQQQQRRHHHEELSLVDAEEGQTVVTTSHSQSRVKPPTQTVAAPPKHTFKRSPRISPRDNSGKYQQQHQQGGNDVVLYNISDHVDTEIDHHGHGHGQDDGLVVIQPELQPKTGPVVIYARDSDNTNVHTSDSIANSRKQQAQQMIYQSLLASDSNNNNNKKMGGGASGPGVNDGRNDADVVAEAGMIPENYTQNTDVYNYLSAVIAIMAKEQQARLLLYSKWKTATLFKLPTYVTLCKCVYDEMTGNKQVSGSNHIARVHQKSSATTNNNNNNNLRSSSGGSSSIHSHNNRSASSDIESDNRSHPETDRQIDHNHGVVESDHRHDEQVNNTRIENEFFILNLFAYIASFFIIGHLFTKIGRKCWYLIFWNYFTFIHVSLGIWTDDAVVAFDLIDNVESIFKEHILKGNPKSTEEDNKLYFSRALAAIIGMRSILYQIFSPITLLSVLCVGISGTPMFIYSKTLLNRLPPPFMNNCYELARNVEVHYSVGGDVSEYQWAVTLRGIQIYYTQSRAIQFLLNVYLFLLSVGILFMSRRYWLISSLVVLIPYSIIYSLIFIVYFGKALDIRDKDLRYITWCCVCFGDTSGIRRDANGNEIRSSADGGSAGPSSRTGSGNNSRRPPPSITTQTAANNRNTNPSPTSLMIRNPNNNNNNSGSSSSSSQVATESSIAVQSAAAQAAAELAGGPIQSGAVIGSSSGRGSMGPSNNTNNSNNSNSSNINNIQGSGRGNYTTLQTTSSNEEVEMTVVHRYND